MEFPTSTTPTIAGKEIEGCLGIACGEAIMGANIIRDFMAHVTDVVGGRSGAYEEKLRDARETALLEMLDEAKTRGADGVVGIDIDYETIGQSMLMVTATGTAVRLKKR